MSDEIEHDKPDAITRLRDENERLRVQNIQMQAALGYAICAEDERHIIPSNPYSCGVCDANRGVHDEIERLRAALREIAKVTRGWEPGVWTEEEGRQYFAALFFGAQKVARAALKEKIDD